MAFDDTVYRYWHVLEIYYILDRKGIFQLEAGEILMRNTMNPDAKFWCS